MAERASGRVLREVGMGSVTRLVNAGIAQTGGSQRVAGPDTAEEGSPVAAQAAVVAGDMAVAGEKGTRNRAEGNQRNQVARGAVAGFRLVRSNRSTTSRV